jgi:Tol biopolymer transport system component
VASIYGFEDSAGIRFLVMELVEGEDLAHRLGHGRISLDETLHIARQIAAGLEAAHEKGIVHRDLKPANVMLSPEQARGRNVDRRADIWAFGVILWEMVTGAPLFEGETVSDTLAAVLRAEPEWDRLPVDEAPILCRLIERCLVRDPRQRLRDIGEARILLQEGGAHASHLSLSGIVAAPPERPPAPRTRVGWPLGVILAVSLLGAGVLAGWKLIASNPKLPLLHTMIPPPRGADFDLSGSAPGPAMLAPDGSMLTFTARDDDGVTRLYLRHLDREESVSLSGTEGAAYPFWSPDSRFIGFFTPNVSQKLKKVGVSGGPPVTLCAANNGKGGSWNEGGTIIFAPSHDSGIFQVPSIGGEPTAVTELGEGEGSHRHPRFLPNGRDFLFLARTTESAQIHSIRMGSLHGGEIRQITESECQAEFSQGRLLTVREGVLMATPFDPTQARLTGGGTPLVENVLIASSGAAAGSYSVAPSGMMTYQTGVSQTDRILQWAELDTENSSSVGTVGQLFHPRLSPDGSRCMIEVRGESQEGTDLWLVELDTGLRTRFTFEQGEEVAPCWTPDGDFVIYVSRTTEINRIIQQPVEGVGGTTILYESQSRLRPSSVSSDGRTLLFDQAVDGGNVDILALSLEEDLEPRTVLSTEASEGGGRFSPDGRWIAYHATSANTWDVFVMPASGGSRKWQVTNVGAVYPQWKSDGSELLVSNFNGSVTAFEVDIHGDSFHVGNSEQVGVTESPSSAGVAFSIHPDGRRILRAGADPTSQAEVSLIHLVSDWEQALAR